jgi:hypothetical protein
MRVIRVIRVTIEGIWVIRVIGVIKVKVELR